jgi:hypothetical protein
MFTAATLAAFLTANQCVPAKLVDVMVGVALNENPKLDASAINHNANGTIDYGLAQVNTVNLGWTGLTPVTALDPCKNIAAAAKVLFARYNGNAPVRMKVAYTNGVLSRLSDASPVMSLTPTLCAHYALRPGTHGEPPRAAKIQAQAIRVRKQC